MNDMDYCALLYEVKEGVAVIRFNRPERMNAIGGTLRSELSHALFEQAGNDPAVHCVIITGAGDRAFCAGADIKERANRRLAQAEYHLEQKRTHSLYRRIEQFEKPIIAAINGVALGGGLEIALCCDIRIAARSARLGLPEARIGAMPAAGGTQRLPRLVGVGYAKELMFTADHITAERAHTIGLVNQVVDDAELIPTAVAIAQRIAANAPLAIRHIKHAIDVGMQVGIDAGLEYERYAAALVISSEDRKEGMQAFLEKRSPNFQGR